MRNGIAVKLAAVAVTAAVASGAHTALAQGILKADTTGVGGVNHTLFVVLANILQKKAGINMQVNEGQTLTRSALKLGKGKIDIQPLPPVITPWLRKGIRMYKKAPDVARKAAANIRLIASYGAGVRHYLVWADSGIETFDDLKGKRVFVGPPVGGASVVAMAVLRITAGRRTRTTPRCACPGTAASRRCRTARSTSSSVPRASARPPSNSSARSGSFAC